MSDKKPERKALYVRLENHLKQRMLAQCERLHITQAAAVNQAMVKWLEEEEKIQEIHQQR